MASGEQQIPRSSSPLRGCGRTRNDKSFFSYFRKDVDAEDGVDAALGAARLAEPAEHVGVRRMVTGAGCAVPSGTRFLFLLLTPDLRPGLSYAAPPGLERDGSFCTLRPLSVRDVPSGGLKPASICEPYAALKAPLFHGSAGGRCQGRKRGAKAQLLSEVFYRSAGSGAAPKICSVAPAEESQHQSQRQRTRVSVPHQGQN
jgi:hypothetical protein